MKTYITGLLSGIVLTAGLFLFTGATQEQDDSLQILLQRLEAYLESEVSKERQSGRYQLQSFHIERTHWHYLLDSATGQLYRLEPSRTPANSQWVLTAGPNFKP